MARRRYRDNKITEDEVSKAVKRLKNGKACGADCILNKMIKAFSENHLHLLTQTFNVVLLSGHIYIYQTSGQLV